MLRKLIKFSFGVEMVFTGELLITEKPKDEKKRLQDAIYSLPREEMKPRDTSKQEDAKKHVDDFPFLRVVKVEEKDGKKKPKQDLLILYKHNDLAGNLIFDGRKEEHGVFPFNPNYDEANNIHLEYAFLQDSSIVLPIMTSKLIVQILLSLKNIILIFCNFLLKK